MIQCTAWHRSRLVCLVLAALAAPGSAPSAHPSERDSSDRVRVVPVPHGGFVPDAEVDDGGTLHLVYVLKDNVYYVTSPNDGGRFSEPLRVNDEEGFAYGGAYRGPDLAIGDKGTVHVVWYNAAYQQKRPKEQWGVMYSRLAPGATAFEPARNLNHKPSDNYALAADPVGNVAVFWMADGVFASVSRDGGDTFSTAVDLNTDPCECCGSRATFAHNSLYVLYRDKADNTRDTFLAFSKDNGPFTHAQVSQRGWHIESCPMTGSFLAPAPGGLIAAWETKGHIYFARLRKSGQLLSRGEIRASERGRYPVVLAAPDGVTVAAWKNGTRLEWQLYGADDEPRGAANATSASSGDRPGGVVTKNGRFLIFP